MRLASAIQRRRGHTDRSIPFWNSDQATGWLDLAVEEDAPPEAGGCEQAVPAPDYRRLVRLPVLARHQKRGPRRRRPEPTHWKQRRMRGAGGLQPP